MQFLRISPCRSEAEPMQIRSRAHADPKQSPCRSETEVQGQTGVQKLVCGECAQDTMEKEDPAMCNSARINRPDQRKCPENDKPGLTATLGETRFVMSFAKAVEDEKNGCVVLPGVFFLPLSTFLQIPTAYPVVAGWTKEIVWIRILAARPAGTNRCFAKRFCRKVVAGVRSCNSANLFPGFSSLDLGLLAFRTITIFFRGFMGRRGKFASTRRTPFWFHFRPFPIFPYPSPPEFYAAGVWMRFTLFSLISMAQVYLSYHPSKRMSSG